MNIKNSLWLLPFCSFSLGYFCMHMVFYMPSVNTPHLIGKPVHEILKLITEKKLNLRLIDQKEETDIPEGIILNQTPSAGTLIKPNQPLFIVTTKKPLARNAPDCIKGNLDQLENQLLAEGIQFRVYHLSHSYPEKMCFAQSPQHNECLEKNKLILYISSGDKKPILWPNFISLPLRTAIDFLNTYGITPHIVNDSVYNEYKDAEYIVTDQRPTSGTLLTIDDQKPLSVQLRVQTLKEY